VVRVSWHWESRILAATQTRNRIAQGQLARRPAVVGVRVCVVTFGDGHACVDGIEHTLDVAQCDE
jgi:hypothetical protein